MIPPFRREFDAAQDPQTARNALGIVKTASWTPTISFDTPGDLAVVYSARLGRIFTVGEMKVVALEIATSTFTFTTASGNFIITGLPLATAASFNLTGQLGHWSQVTLSAGRTQLALRLQAASSTIQLIQSGSATNAALAAVANFTTGSNIALRGHLIYFIS